MTKDRIKATLWQCLMLPSIALIAYSAIYAGIEGAANVLIFTAWLMAVVGTISLFSIAKAPSPRGYIPRIFGRVLWVWIAVSLLWHGWWFTGFAFVWAWFTIAAAGLALREKFPEAAT